MPYGCTFTSSQSLYGLLFYIVLHHLFVQIWADSYSAIHWRGVLGKQSRSPVLDAAVGIFCHDLFDRQYVAILIRLKLLLLTQLRAASDVNRRLWSCVLESMYKGIAFRWGLWPHLQRQSGNIIPVYVIGQCLSYQSDCYENNGL